MGRNPIRTRPAGLSIRRRSQAEIRWRGAQHGRREDDETLRKRPSCRIEGRHGALTYITPGGNAQGDAQKESLMKVVLFCGGAGMRLRGYVDDVPKPMVQI